MPLRLQERLKALGTGGGDWEGYGLTESFSQEEPARPLPAQAWLRRHTQIEVEMKIVDRETGIEELPPNETGEILINHPR